MSKRSDLLKELAILRMEREELLAKLKRIRAGDPIDEICDKLDIVAIQTVEVEADLSELDKPKLGCSCCRDMPSSLNLPDGQDDVWAEVSELCANDIIEILREYKIHDPVFVNSVLQSVSFWMRWHSEQDQDPYAHVSERAKSISGKLYPHKTENPEVWFDDNLGFWEVSDPDVRRVYFETQERSVWKPCEGCGREVKVLPAVTQCYECRSDATVYPADLPDVEFTKFL